MKKYLYIFLTLIIFTTVVNFAHALTANNNVYVSKKYIQSNNNTQSEPSDIIEFVIDYSGSMSSNVRIVLDTMNKIVPQIPEKTKTGLRILGPSYSVTETIYKKSRGNEDIITHVQKTYSSCKATQKIVNIAPNNSRTILSKLAPLKTTGVTPITLALEETVNKDFAGFGRNLKKKIILITDGGENCKKSPCDFVNNLILSRQDITIDVIMFGNSTYNLDCLTRQTKGNFYFANSTNFNQVFQNSVENKPVPQNTTKPKPIPQTSTQRTTPAPQNTNNGHGYQYIPD